MRTAVVAAILGVLLLATSAFADVTLLTTTNGTGAVGEALAGESTTFIKGAKMRVDRLVDGQERSTIFDIDGQQIIVLHHERGEATVHSMEEAQAALKSLEADAMTASLTPTGTIREIAGNTCDEHVLELTVPMSLDRSTPLTITSSGPACIVADTPGAADYAAFFTSAANEGFIVAGDAAGAERNPGYARSMTEIYRQIAALGVPYELEMTLTVSGEGGLAALMSRVGAMSFTSTVQRVTVEPLGDDLFAVPADFEIVEP